MPMRLLLRQLAGDPVETLAALLTRCGGNHGDSLADAVIGRFRSNFNDLAGGIGAENMRELNLHRIVTGAHDAVEGAIDRNRMDFDQDLIRRRFGCGDFFEA